MTHYTVSSAPEYWGADVEPESARELAERMAAHLRRFARSAGIVAVVDVAPDATPQASGDRAALDLLRAEQERTIEGLLSEYYWMTPAEVAAETGTEESTWRRKLIAGQIPGAMKKGKQWLLPRLRLRELGVRV
jgi:excisionase family DNA binding protein